MLIVECKTLKCHADAATRIFILNRLQERGLAPLVRLARRRAYELALQGTERVTGLEQFITRVAEAEGRSSHLAGDVFCLENFILFLIFGDEETEADGIRVGIIARENGLELIIELDGFCREVSAALRDAPRQPQSEANGAAKSREYPEWERRAPLIPAEFERALARWGHAHRWERTSERDEPRLPTTLGFILSQCGITEKQIAVGTVSNREAQAMVCAYGRSLLFISREADLSASDARRMVIKLDETEASQLIVIATGRVDDGARSYLRDQARRQSRSGRSRDVILVEDLDTAQTELQRAFNMAALKQDLSPLDAGLGLPIWALVSASFDLREPVALKKMAASAVKALDLAF